ncbi:hydroxysqualene dehydroxylase [Dyadobacter luticola]|uniref:FAD-binding protein n=1 Tax=Dyadobacter luticola TaxID=1979387 RepID=A0A5R9L668_9BACT|nr:NAD(P)-binding protein [Dyadobacter luticola]TLV03735.1 FAD-binding protein [Dyadobacter luticola]
MPKVVILGGGVAGMSAAHELIERGFEVDVYEKKPVYLGGKARSVAVPGSNLQSPDGYLPGEHGFRFFPGFYQHITDTMKRIPFTDSKGRKNRNGVFDNLVDVTRVGILRNGKKPIITIVSFPKSLADIEAAISVLHTHDTGLLPGEAKFFGTKVLQLMTSCQRRRDLEYEKIGWWEFMDADNHSQGYQHLLVEGLTRTLVAANAKFASTKTGGDIFIQLLFNIANPGMHTDRVLNGPTNDVWLKPWEDYLTKKGVRFFKGALVEKLICNNKNNVTGVQIQNWEKSTDNNYVPYDPPAAGDYYLLATPVEVAAVVIPDEVKQNNGSLEHITELAKDVAWMNGIQFYLNKTLDVVQGHCIYVDSQWAITSISQLPFWGDYDIRTKGDGHVKAILSVDVSDWDEYFPPLGAADPSGLTPMKAKDCKTYDEIEARVWEQLKRSLNVNGAEILTDDMKQGTYTDNSQTFKGYYLDHSLNEENTPAAKDPSASDPGKSSFKIELVDHEPLLVNTVNSWANRPDAFLPGTSNLFLASDYVRTNTDLATMEGANEAARRAVNCIIDVSGQDAPACKIWNLHEPVFFAPFKWYDAWRYRQGMPYKKPPKWFDNLMVVWGIIYGAGFFLYTAWTFVTGWFSKK